jgi:ADP-ribose pyrophosphatase YjhB (NUDIX family)
MRRRLADKLVLIVRGPAGSALAGPGRDEAWTFPTAAHKAGESIRQTAERALKHAIGPSQVYFIGNAPMAHLTLTHGPGGDSGQQEEGSVVQPAAAAAAAAAAAHSPAAGHIFFHLAQVVNDPWEVTSAAGGAGAAAEHAWVAPDELGQFLSDERLLSLARAML